ncbi:MAG: 1-(5-phosphoribosyl)-5-amino-4-imidazole-carboxylate carboxylase [Kiritimatiellaceae bacterium TMED266]|nr:MAG: 1-(5-phosphoribosyl)-5-amino-4-imidazole-carboxylate carboxylase [Kiritimatiellaceae bacterium TMED266]
MDRDKIITLLEDVKNGTIETAEAVEKLRSLPFQELDFAKIDHHRSLRTGHPEVIFCQGKAPEHVERIYQNMAENNADILLTRADKDLFDRLHAIDSRLRYNELARTILLETSQREKTGHVLIISAGTADLPVAEEAAETAQISGARIEKIYDAGVAGIHRLLAHTETIQQARCIVTVAGMEGALPSVVGGLASCPVIAVPTSIGYGAHLQGLAPLLTMLNSCSSNITVVNIDNGFGAGFNAALINADR